MFGYVTIYKPKLNKEDLDQYQAYYCGLCRELKKKVGILGQFTLTYDMTFLIVLLDGLYEKENTSVLERCAAHPTKKHRMDYNEITEYAADMNLLLAYYNMMDDWIDDKKVSKLTLAKILESHIRRLKEKYPRQCKAVENYMECLHQSEKGKSKDLDEASGYTGEMLGELLVMREDEWSQELKGLGFYLGKFIYLMDAYEDIEKDKKSDQYNPWLLQYNNQLEIELQCEEILNLIMADCARSFERLPIIQNASILRNILYAGVWTRFDLISSKRRKKTGENL